MGSYAILDWVRYTITVNIFKCFCQNVKVIQIMDCSNIITIESSFSVTRNVFTYPFDSILYFKI